MSAHPGPLAQRRSGILLHPTALAGDGRGALGARARAWIDWLAEAGFTLWQVLPLGPPGADGSPYWARSDCAGYTALIDPFECPHAEHDGADYAAFCAEAHAWLEDYVLYEALAERWRAPWWEWPEPLRRREPQALAEARLAAGAGLETRRREQWHFDWQWRALRRYAAERGVRLVGDVPIYVAPDSVATWAEPAQFQLDGSGRPIEVAGVPPDYFAVDGQLWGNPLYAWDRAEADGFAFWCRRMRWQRRRVDALRIDHFRGLAAYWAVPAGAATAREGHWVQAPGQALLQALREALPDLPLLAEDLGVITPDVDALRREFALPGMRVLQFGFDGSPDNPHLPHNFTPDLAVYTGTHDNDTTAGWFRGLDGEAARRVERYLLGEGRAGVGAEGVVAGMIRACLASVARTAIVPAQDLLGLGSEARFNTPGTVRGNWSWRAPLAPFDAPLAAHYRALNQAFGRRV